MRTTAEENDRIGRWIGERLNAMDGPVRFFLPEGGVSALDAAGRPFWDPDADAALFRAGSHRAPDQPPAADPAGLQHQRPRICGGGRQRISYADRTSGLTPADGEVNNAPI
jgi:hypothetical protein